MSIPDRIITEMELRHNPHWFWLWYAVPLGAFLVGRPELGAAIYGAYGIIRGMAAWVIFLGLEQWLQKNSAEWLLQRAETAQVIASGQLVLLGVTVVIAIGF